MNLSIYYQYNPWWDGQFNLPNIIERPEISKKIEKSLSDRSIVILTGLRRIGKTTLMKLMIRQMLQNGIDPAHIFYTSLDDYLLADRSIIEIIDEYRKIQRLSVDQKIYLFLDEVASKNDFQIQLKNIYDRENVKIYASSSSSSVLRDCKAALTGRERVIEVLPLDFYEFLSFRNISIPKRDQSVEGSYFEEYLHTGGIPEYVLSGEREYMKNLVDDIISKDIIAFHGIKNRKQIRDCFLLLMESAGSTVSLSRIANILKVSPDTSSRFINLFEETYLIHLVQRDGKTAERLLAPKKIYIADLGIRSLFSKQINIGKLFENYIFLMIKQFNPRYIYKNSLEIDFYFDKNILVEVKYGEDLNEKQCKLFEAYPAKHRLLLKNLDDLKTLKNLLQKQ
ncbi:MAG: ATP-binding protein [Chrysiogenales bacterium]